LQVYQSINQSINLYFRHWTHRTIKNIKLIRKKTERDRENAAIQSHNINQSHQVKVYEILYNAVVTSKDLTLKVISAFINQTVKFL